MAMPVGFIPRRVMQIELLQIQPCSMHTTLFARKASTCQADSMMVISHYSTAAIWQNILLHPHLVSMKCSFSSASCASSLFVNLGKVATRAGMERRAGQDYYIPPPGGPPRGSEGRARCQRLPAHPPASSHSAPAGTPCRSAPALSGSGCTLTSLRVHLSLLSLS